MESCDKACCGQQHDCHEDGDTAEMVRVCLSAVVLFAGLLCQWLGVPLFRLEWVRAAWYAVGWMPVAFPVMKEVVEAMRARDYFNEFLLMLLASIGAFVLGEYAEGVAVMLFYAVGEMAQERAAGKARGHIRSLLDMRPRVVTVWRGGERCGVPPETVAVGEEIEVKVGERVPLDGVLVEGAAAFNASALTGESVPRMIEAGDEVLSGLIPDSRVVRLRTVRVYSDSALSRIVDMVENASARKAPTERFIHRFAKVYTPTVVGLATLLFVLPAFYSLFDAAFVYDFRTWLYRALVFLVVSCPCALVISIPLGYFGGIGAASKRGILFKGSQYLDAIARVDTVVFDKTGTLTRGVFSVREVLPSYGVSESDLVACAAAVECGSNHPIARAVKEYARKCRLEIPELQNIEELSGLGLCAETERGKLLAGKAALLEAHGIPCPRNLAQTPETVVAVSLGDRYMGCLLLSDELKPDVAQAIASLKKTGVAKMCVLSGDKTALVAKLAGELGITRYAGDLMPADKLRYIEEMKREEQAHVAFVGDGLNDAPVLAASHVGIAMGGQGSDVAIEAADVVLQTDRPSAIPDAIHIARRTRAIVWQNIIGAVGVKLLVLIMGAFGVATLWEAVFADVGVALLAILNSVRLLGAKKR